jgi:hypothetical protein
MSFLAFCELHCNFSAVFSVCTAQSSSTYSTQSGKNPCKLWFCYVFLCPSCVCLPLKSTITATPPSHDIITYRQLGNHTYYSTTYCWYLIYITCHIMSRYLTCTPTKLSASYTQTTWQHHPQVTIYTDNSVMQLSMPLY